MVNFTPYTFEKIHLSKYDHCSFDDFVDSGFVHSDFKILLPDKYLIIDSLSSFDLEFICEYSVTFKQKGDAPIINLEFELPKYARFEVENNKYYFKEIDLSGYIMDTKIKSQSI